MFYTVMCTYFEQPPCVCAAAICNTFAVWCVVCCVFMLLVVEYRRGLGIGEGGTVSRYRSRVLFEIWDYVYLCVCHSYVGPSYVLYIYIWYFSTVFKCKKKIRRACT
jgi:hypothetical protein